MLWIIIFLFSIFAAFSPYINDGLVGRIKLAILGFSSYAASLNSIETQAGINARLVTACAVVLILALIATKRHRLINKNGIQQ